MTELKKKPLFNPEGDLDVRLRRMIGGNTTNLNDFNNMKYAWVSDWYRQAMNNFWIPEEINLSQDVKDYPRLLSAERSAYDKILSFLVFLDSIQTANLPNIGAYITANEVNLCLSIQAFQECVHSQSYALAVLLRRFALPQLSQPSALWLPCAGSQHLFGAAGGCLHR